MSSNEFMNIEATFTKYLSGSISTKELEKQISALLTHHKFMPSTKTFKVFVVDYGNEPFCGMSVIPLSTFDISSMLVSKSIDDKDPMASYRHLYNKWREIESWSIEIDNRVFDKSYIQLNPRELTAMLIHEIGHTIFSDKKFEAFYRMYREVRLRYDLNQRTKMSFAYFILSIPLVIAASVHTVVIGRNGINEEKFCDELTIKYGYSDDLISAFNKIIAYYGSTAFLTPSASEDKISQELVWSFNTVSDIIIRKRSLNTQMTLRALKTKSPTLKDAYMSVVSLFGTIIREKKTGLVFESMNAAFDAIEKSDAPILENFEIDYDLKAMTALENLFSNIDNKPAYESFIDTIDRKKLEKEVKNLRVSEYDIDVIFVEIDKIANNYDRVYVLDLIYNLYEKLDVIEDMSMYDYRVKNKYEHKLPLWRDKLSIARQKCLNKEIRPQSYGLFVPVPKGYEG